MAFFTSPSEKSKSERSYQDHSIKIQKKFALTKKVLSRKNAILLNNPKKRGLFEGQGIYVYICIYIYVYIYVYMCIYIYTQYIYTLICKLQDNGVCIFFSVLLGPEWSPKKVTNLLPTAKGQKTWPELGQLTLRRSSFPKRVLSTWHFFGPSMAVLYF